MYIYIINVCIYRCGFPDFQLSLSNSTGHEDFKGGNQKLLAKILPKHVVQLVSETWTRFQQLGKAIRSEILTSDQTSGVI